MRALVLLVALAGCSSSLGASSSGTVVAASTSAGFAPAVVVTSPAPGSWVNGPRLAIEGRARDAVSVELGGAPATLANGVFRGDVPIPEPGVTTVTIRARDRAGNDHFGHVSYVAGPFRSDAIPEAVHLEVAASALVPANALVQDAVRALDLDALARSVSPLPLAIAGGIVTVEVDFLKATHAPPLTKLALGNGTIDVEAEVGSVSVDAVVHDRGGALRIPATVTARSLRARASAGIVTGSPARCALGTPAVVVDGLDVQARGLLPNLLADLLRKTIEKLLARELARTIEKQVPRILDQELARVHAGTRVRVGKGEVDLALRPRLAAIRPSGISLLLGADVLPAGQPSPEWPSRTTTPPTLAGSRDVRLAISRDLVAKSLVALWKAGSLDQEIRGGTTLPLDCAALARLVPELASHGDPGTPVVAAVRPVCPPELRLDAGRLELVLGEVHVEAFADEPAGRRSLLTVSIHARVPVDAAVRGGALSVTPAPARPRFLFSVVRQPVARVDEARLATRLTVLADAVLANALAPLGSIPLPTVLGRPIRHADLAVGVDHLVLAADVR